MRKATARDWKTGWLAMLGLALPGPSMMSGAALAATAPAPADMLALRAGEVIEALRGRRKAGAVFNAHFLADVSPDRFAALAERLRAENGRVLAAENVRAQGRNAATFIIRFERATATGHLTLEPAAPRKVSGFHIGVAIPLADTSEKIATAFAALPGRAGFAVTRLGDGAPAPVASVRGDEQFAIGSTFKLWVLDALAEEIAAGRHRWDEVVPIGPRSLPGGVTQTWPAGAPATVETLATLMISQSDNTATDTLIRLIGRDRLGERVRASGHSDPARMLPLPTTAEVFALKLGPPELRAAYAGADEAGQERLLANLDAAAVLATADAAELDGKPVAIDAIEWFASPNDIVRIVDRLRRRADPRVRAILAVAGNLDPGQRRNFAYVGYKGGSESGVLNLTWLLRRTTGEWLAVTASWNDPARPLDHARLEALTQRLIDGAS